MASMGSAQCVSFARVSCAQSCTVMQREQRMPIRLVDKYESNSTLIFLKMRVSVQAHN